MKVTALQGLPPELCGMIERGVSVIVASRDAAQRPSIMRAIGSEVAREAGAVTVYLARAQSQRLLQDVEAGGPVAVVFSQPHSHCTVQLKASRAAVRAAGPDDAPQLARYLASMEQEIALIGFPAAFARAMLAHRLEDLVALRFEPEQAFDQTPGPRAGAAFGGPAGSAPAAAATPPGDVPHAMPADALAEAPTGAPADQPRPAPAHLLCDIRICLEGAIPGVMATCARDGTPNVAYISQVYYVDERHVALSFQFFNKTRLNILDNPLATVLVLNPLTAAFHRLHLRYVRTEADGPLFEGMKAQLAGIASHSGMAGVFRLLGSDVYEVLHIEAVEGEPLPEPPPRAGRLATVRRCSERLARCTALDELLNATLQTLGEGLDVRHAMVLMLDGNGRRLYTVASTGYATSGVGSEVELGDGVIGVAARERTPVRIGHMTTAYLYSRAMRSSLEANVPDLAPATDIPYPGLPHPHSQLAVPILSAGRLLGVLFAESPNDVQFGFEDEDVFVAVAGHLGAAIDLLQQSAAVEPAAVAAAAAPSGKPEEPASSAAGAPLQLRRYASNDSVFIDGAYLIKGVAGAIFWKLVGDHQREGRTEFSNRELRLDPAIRLPDVSDNLEARLVLLQRRLDEQSPHVRIEKTGRGRFRLVVRRPLQLQESA